MRPKRLIRIITYALCILMAGFVYGIFFQYTGLAIPCPFHKLTWLKCPGCGITGMCIALIQLDFKEAFLCHPVLFLLLVPLGAVCAGSAITYIREGSGQMKRWQNVILYASIVLLVGYGVVRIWCRYFL
ncbi:MAG: DUF2752 domain-containing protein [Lachnospiraceae bacterium]|nr:DUF2752 domain-containing protein [Lachnospiraceae bacterium]